MQKLPYLPFSGVKEGETLSDALIKIDKALSSMNNRIKTVEEVVNQINGRFLQYRRNKKF